MAQNHRPPPKGRGAAPPMPGGKAKGNGGKGAAKDTKATVTILAAPKGTTRMLAVLLRGYGTAGITASEDGATRSLAIERRKAREMLFKIRKLWRAEEVAVTFSQGGVDVTTAIEGEAPPAPIVENQSKTQTILAKARAQAQERATARGEPEMAESVDSDRAVGVPKPAPGPKQEWGWKNSALDNPPPQQERPTIAMAGLDRNIVEGVNGEWPFANGYRPVDADKLDAQSRRKVQLRDGKQKISLGAASDRQYLIEPDRTRGGWTVSRLTTDASNREFLGNSQEGYRDAVMILTAFEENRARKPQAQAQAQAKAPAAPAPSAAPAPAAAPAATPAPAPAPGGPKAEHRWTVQQGKTVLAQADDLEDAVQAAFAKSPAPMFVVGWDGRVPARARVFLDEVEEEEEIIELDLQAGLAMNAEAAERLRKALAAQRGEAEGTDGATEGAPGVDVDAGEQPESDVDVDVGEGDALAEAESGALAEAEGDDAPSAV